jgi:hypothetical protein
LLYLEACKTLSCVGEKLMSSGICDYTGFGSSVTSFACNASSGVLSQSQVNDIKAEASAQVVQASAGRQPAVVQALVNQVNGEIDAALSTFSEPGESPTDVGALPSQSAGLRVAGTGNITLAKLKEAIPQLPDLTNLKYWIIGALVIAGIVYTLPYTAPAIKRGISAVK